MKFTYLCITLALIFVLSYSEDVPLVTNQHIEFQRFEEQEFPAVSYQNVSFSYISLFLAAVNDRYSNVSF